MQPSIQCQLSLLKSISPQKRSLLTHHPIKYQNSVLTRSTSQVANQRDQNKQRFRRKLNKSEVVAQLQR